MGMVPASRSPGAEWVAVRLMPKADATDLASGDARVLDLEFRANVRVTRTWREVCEKLTMLQLAGWPVLGPRTCEWCCRFLNRRSGGPTDWHRFFRALYKLEKGDWGLEVHELALRLLERAGCFDGLDVCNLSILEELMRHAQLVEYAYLQESAGRDKGKGKGVAGLSDEAAFFTGTYREAGNAMVSPDLLEWVGKEVERDAGVLKQLREAREEKRFLADQSKKKKKGKGGEDE